MVYGDHTLTYNNNPKNVFDYYDDFDPNGERLFEEYCNVGGTYDYTGSLEMNWNTKLLLISKKSHPISKEYIMEVYEVNNNSTGTPGIGVVDSDTEEGYFFARQSGDSKIYSNLAGQTLYNGGTIAQHAGTYASTGGISSIKFASNSYVQIKTPSQQNANWYTLSQASLTDSIRFVIGGIESHPASYKTEWVRIRQDKVLIPSDASTAYENNYQKPDHLNIFSGQLSNGEYYFTPGNYNNTNVVWDFGDGNTSTQFEPFHFYTSNGTYTVCMTYLSPDNCPFTSCKEITVTSVQDGNPNTSLNEAELINVELYPNPTTGISNINLSKNLDNYSAKIIDLTGREVYTTSQLSGNTFTVDLSNLAKENYTLLIKSDSNQFFKSIIKH